MIVKKITTGFVIQEFDTEKKEYVKQEFIAGDEVDYETENEGEGDDWLDNDGKVVDPSNIMLNEAGVEPYLPFTMMQPVDMDIPDTLVIVVEGGVVQGVENLLTDQSYVLLDKDVHEKNHPGTMQGSGHPLDELRR